MDLITCYSKQEGAEMHRGRQQRIRFNLGTTNQAVQKSMLLAEKKIGLTTEYVILAPNQHFIFTFHHFNA